MHFKHVQTFTETHEHPAVDRRGMLGYANVNMARMDGFLTKYP